MTNDQFKALLDRHDWHYEMTDDIGLYLKGNAERLTILEATKLSPELEETFKEYEKTKRV